MDLNPQATYLHLTLDKSFITGGKSQQALTEIEREPSEWGKLTGQALAYHALGREQGFDAALAGLIAKYSIEGAYQNSSGVGVSRAVRESFTWLERAYQQRDPRLPEINSDPLFKISTTTRDTPNFSGKSTCRHNTAESTVAAAGCSATAFWLDAKTFFAARSVGR
jgi:hypothetical protein